MRKLFVALLILVAGLSANASVPDVILPAPGSVEMLRGTLDITGPFTFSSQGISDSTEGFLHDMLIDSGLFRDAQYGGASQIKFVLASALSTMLQGESYILQIDRSGVQITAADRAGLFYGVQSLLQLAQYYRNEIPAQIIYDYPRFAYRGLMIDVSRHFRSKEFVKKQIDAMARYKLNRLHLHLTDDAGWRIEIPGRPELTDNAAWRQGVSWSDWIAGGRKYCHKGDPGAYGGYYTVEDAREIVRYAALRGIEVIPEIEFPGHSGELLAVYPGLSCTGQAGASELCLGNAETLHLMEDVLTRIMEIFPSRYIHIGGDEAAAGVWKTCPKCLEMVRSQGLASTDELQGYMIRRLTSFLEAHGRKLLGWDEIAGANLPHEATVMVWRGVEDGIAVADKGYDVVMAPGAYCYLDRYQDAPPSQPQAMAGLLTLERVYGYDPAPDSLRAATKSHIIGLQACPWAEYITQDSHAEYMMYPRLLAIAEVGWSSPKRKNYADFRVRAVRESGWLTEQGYTVFDLTHEIGPRPQSLRRWDNLATGKPVRYLAPYNPKYAASGDKTLTDGLRGNWSYGDGRWQGFLTPGVDVVIDMGKRMRISGVHAEFMQCDAAWVWMPAVVEVYVSDDDLNFSLLGSAGTSVSEESHAVSFETLGWQGRAQGRYIRFKATDNGRAGGWVFTDEIFVQ